MKKRYISLVIITIFAFLIAAGSVSATEDFESIFMTGSNGSTTPQSTFGWDETPYLYLKISEDLPNFGSSIWYTDSFVSDAEMDTVNVSQESWVSLADWDNHKKIGDWTVKPTYFSLSLFDGLSSYTGSTSFTVTPEPLSMILFAVGGAPIAFKLRRKRRRV